MAVFDKWVVLKIVEFLFCVACLVAKRVSTDDEARLALLLQKLSREWSLLTSVTWDNVGGAFADAIYGGYVIITFALIVGRVFQEVPVGRRILEGVLLGFGMLFFLVLGGLELASLDSVPSNLTVNAAVLGTITLIVAALFLIDLMGPRLYTSTRYSQTDPVMSAKNDKKVKILTQPPTNGHISNGVQNGQAPAPVLGSPGPERPKTLDLEKGTDIKMRDDLQDAVDGLTKLEEMNIEKDLEKSKFGSLRNGFENGNYVRLSDPLSEVDRLHYERELAKFNERYVRDYYSNIQERLSVKEKYLPELQAPVFAKVKSNKKKNYDELSSNYDDKRNQSPTRAKTVPTPTLQQLEDYLRGSFRTRRADTPALFPMEPIEEKDGQDVEGRASGTPTDPGYVQYTANKWPDKREIRTPRHSPTQ